MQTVTRRAGTHAWTPSLVLWIPLGILGWVGTVWLGVTLYASDPRTAGFDLELLLVAGRQVAAGLSPYDLSLLSGVSPAAPSLFYSYPPPVAQVASLVAGIPSAAMLLVLDLAAALGLVLVTEGLRRKLAIDRSRSSVLLPVVAIAPFVFPFTVGLLFGNADVLFPFLYGVMLLSALATSRTGSAMGGVALALAALKLHPASLGFWFLGRGIAQRVSGLPPRAWLAVVAAVAGVLAILGASLAVGGPGPWSEYIGVVRAGSGADVVDPRNAGPAAILAMAIGGDSGAARVLQIPITLIAVAVSMTVAIRDNDTVESFGVAAVASLVTLPVTWYHYPAALMPVVIAALLRARGDRTRRTAAAAAAAVVIATIAVVWLPLLWAAIAFVLLSARWSRPDPLGAGPDLGVGLTVAAQEPA